MKIVHAITALPRSAGTTAFCARVAEEQAKAGNSVTVIVKEFVPERDVMPQGCALVIWQPGEELPAGADVVHSHTPWVLWAHAVHAQARKQGYKIVQSTHGSYSPWAMKHKWLKKFLPWHLWQKRDLARSAMLHTTARLETEQLRALGFTNPIVEAPLGTDMPHIRAEFSGTEKVLLFVGRVYPVKGLDLLVQAWDRTNTAGWKLRVVGPDWGGYLQVLRSMCHSKNVEFAGPLYGEDLERAYACARALILPSYTENFGGVVVDAMSYGLPVLTSEATPWNFLSEKGCGWHFPTTVDAVEEKLRVLISTPDAELKRMGENSRRLAQECYSWESVAKKMIEAYGL